MTFVFPMLFPAMCCKSCRKIVDQNGRVSVVVDEKWDGWLCKECQ